MIRYFCECGNDDPDLFDVYVTQGDLCDILTVVCKQCGDIREDFVACNRDSIMLRQYMPNSA